MALALSDGRWLVARHERGTHTSTGFLVAVLLSGVAVAIGAYPLVRRLTRRLERLQSRVDALGEGDLGARVEVEGNDEVAELARSFNRAAGRIEKLVEAQKTLLAGASHELRSPLARIRVATELLDEGGGPSALTSGIARDIEELDELIAELLLASRLDAAELVSPAEQRAEVELLALAAAEATRVDATISGQEVTVRGDANLLRRALRNLVSNARRHAEGAPVALEVRREEGRAVVVVADSGPGVPEEERGKLFEAFYRGERARARAEDGVGLGLFLVERIARHHGGAVRLVPSATGARFELELPAYDRPDTDTSVQR
jgi:signal transduction histidine kinase